MSAGQLSNAAEHIQLIGQGVIAETDLTICT